MQPSEQSTEGDETPGQWGADLLRRTSSRILRTSSATATGGAAVIPPLLPEPLSERTPLTRQPTRREAAMDQARQQMTEELTAFVTRRLGWILAIFALFLLMSFALLYLVAGAIYALLAHGDEPCDQPLKYYAIAVFAFIPIWTQISSKVAELLRRACSLGPGAACCLSVTLGSPCWGVVGWGLYMVWTSKTCHRTNPGLYYPTKHFILGQIITSCISVVASIVTIFGMRRLLLILSTLEVQPGCQEAVGKLPRVPADSPELIDPEDGQIMDCPVCLESLGSEAVVLRAPCEHTFHEECLARWCKNHVTCPLCRQQVGELDPPPPSELPPV